MQDEEFGPRLKLATKQELMIELTSRKDTCALVIYRAKKTAGQIAYGYSHNFPTNDPLPEILREFARLFDASELTKDASDFI